jgi:small subunit ribosomal protein S21
MDGNRASSIDAGRAFRLESAVTCDSLAYSVGLYGPHRAPRGPVHPANRWLESYSGQKVAAKGVFSSLAEVKVQEGESIESALRRFKRKVQQEDIIKDIKKHSFYLKPGDRRRAKQALARKRTRKKQRREVE